MHTISFLLSFSLLLLSSSLLCPPNTIKLSDQCLGKSACSFSGIDPSRYVIQNNQCKYCINNYFASGDDCIECPKNTFSQTSDNTCHSKNECKISGIDPSRYVIQDHTCKYCLANYFASGDECIECPKNTFGRYNDNTCHTKNECSFSSIDPSRYVIQGHECKYCLINYFAQGDDCQECPKNTFGKHSDNSCHQKNECSFNGIDPSRYVIQGHECKYCRTSYIAQGDDCMECPKNTFGRDKDNSCHSKNECYFSGVEASRYVVQSHECRYCLSGFLAYGDDCLKEKEYPFFEGVDEGFIRPVEKNLTSNLKAILSNLRKSLEKDFQIKVNDLDEEVKTIIAGDPIAKIGTMIAGLKIGCQAVDVLKNKFSTLIMSSFSPYVDDLVEMSEHIKSSKFFAGLARSLEKVETIYGYVIPIGLKQYQDFKNKVNFNKHLSDLVSETFITWGTIEISSEIAASIGATVFGGAIIPTAIAGFAIGVGVQVLADGLVTVKGMTPADFVREGFDKLFEVDKKFLMIQA